MLAEYFYNKDSMNVHRNFVPSKHFELHGWNRFLAERNVMKKAELNMKQNDQKFTSARIKQEVMKQRSKSAGKKNMEQLY